VICQLFFQKKLAAFLPDLRGRGILPPFDEESSASLCVKEDAVKKYFPQHMEYISVLEKYPSLQKIALSHPL